MKLSFALIAATATAKSLSGTAGLNNLPVCDTVNKDGIPVHSKGIPCVWEQNSAAAILPGVLPVVLPASDSGLVGTNGAGQPPAYLSVPEFKDCLGTNSKGASSVVCMPKDMPKKCKKDNWTKITSLNTNLESCDGKDSKKPLGSDPATYTPADLPQPEDSKDSKKPLGSDPATYTPADLPKTEDSKDSKKPLGSDPATYTPTDLPKTEDSKDSKKPLGSDPATYTPTDLPKTEDSRPSKSAGGVCKSSKLIESLLNESSIKANGDICAQETTEVGCGSSKHGACVWTPSTSYIAGGLKSITCINGENISCSSGTRGCYDNSPVYCTGKKTDDTKKPLGSDPATYTPTDLPQTEGSKDSKKTDDTKDTDGAASGARRALRGGR